MASLTKRTIILIICRLANVFVMLLSPIFLVRIFDIHHYGMYLEFMLYAGLLSVLIEFTVTKSLIYFVPKYPGREPESVTNTALMMLVASSIGVVAVYLFKGIVLARTSFDFIAPLLLYLFFFVNLDIFESYWLGKKRTDFVLVFSSGRIIVRTGTLLVAAFLSHNVMVVIYALVGVEFVKCLVVFFLFRGMLTRRFDRAYLKEQLRFIIPLGTSAVINEINNQLANLTISMKMGVESLALYRIGGQQIPILDIVQSSIMDVLFPEMTQRGDAERLSLWQRANVVFCFIAFPCYMVFFYFAPVYIETLFTAQYLAAVPLFRIYVTMILLQCFDTGAPLRSINQNKYFILGGLASLAVNVGLILLLFSMLGFATPALARVLASLAGKIYCGGKILQLYRVDLRKLFLWRKVAIVALCTIIAIPALVVSRWLGINPIVRAVSFSLLYLAIYYFLMRRFKVEEIEILVGKVLSRFRRA